MSCGLACSSFHILSVVASCSDLFIKLAQPIRQGRAPLWKLAHRRAGIGAGYRATGSTRFLRPKICLPGPFRKLIRAFHGRLIRLPQGLLRRQARDRVPVQSTRLLPVPGHGQRRAFGRPADLEEGPLVRPRRHRYRPASNRRNNVHIAPGQIDHHPVCLACLYKNRDVPAVRHLVGRKVESAPQLNV